MRLSKEEAKELAKRKFPALFETAPPALDLRAGERVESFPTDFSALIENDEGERGLAVSNLPFRLASADGQKRRPNLRLVDRGSVFEPVHALAPIEIAASDGEIAFQGTGVRVRPVVAEAAGEGIAVDGHVFLDNVATDSDLLMTAMPRGLETFTILRSEDSPEEQRFEFSVPAGARVVLRGIPAGAGEAPTGARQFVEVVDRDERPILSVAPPRASDADGELVPVTYEVSGETLIVRAEHRGHDYAYPIQVDPLWDIQERFMTWLDHGNAIDNANWRHQVNGSCGWSSLFGNPWWHNYYWGVYSWSNANQWCDDNWWGEWVWVAPRNSRIFRADLGYIRHWWNWSCVELGIWSVRNWRWDAPWETAPDVWRNCSGPPAELAYTWVTLCGDYPCNNWRGSPGNAAVFKLRLQFTGWREASPIAYLGAAALFLQDDENPSIDTLDESPPAPTGWVKDGVYSISPTAHDDGLGMMRYDWIVPGQATQTRTHPCQGTARCPHYWRNPDPSLGSPFNQSFTYNAGTMPEGKQRVTLRAYDALEKSSDANRDIHVDRSGPQIDEPAGTLWDRRNREDDRRFQGLYDAAYTLNVAAGDGSNASDGQRRSGVKRIDVDVVNAQTMAVERSHVDPAPQSCAPSSCSKTRLFTFISDDYSDGEKIVRIKAYDQIDNVATREFNVTVDRRGDIYRADSHRQFAGNGRVPSEDPQWARLGTRSARVEASEWITTRTTFDENGESWDEVRNVARPTDYEDDPTDPANDGEDPYSMERGQGDDPNLDEPAEIQSFRDDYAGQAPTDRGPIENALETWQMPPPAHDQDYVLHEVSGTFTGDDDVERDVVVTTWLDEATRYPLKQRMRDPAGATLMTLYWSYAIGRLEVSEVPADFFAVQPPPQPGMTQEIDHGGTASVGTVQDQQTGAMFTPRSLGPTIVTSLGTFELVENDVVRQTTGPITAQEALAFDPPLPEPGAGPDPDADAPEDAVPAGEDDVFADTLRPDAGAVEPVTSAHVYYRQTAGVSLDPEATRDPLWVSTMARGSAEAKGWRDIYTEHATAIQIDPMDPDFLLAGPMPVVVGLEPTVAYVLAIEDDISSALLDLGETTVIVEGHFQKSDVPTLVGSLRGF